jgi:hypothetical protein
LIPKTRSAVKRYFLSIIIQANKITGILGNGPILAIEAFEVAASHEHGETFRRGRVECGRRHLRQCHSTDPGFAHKTVNLATVFAQGAIFQIIIFHLKDGENHQLSIMDSAITIQSFIILSNEKHKIIDVPILSHREKNDTSA